MDWIAKLLGWFDAYPLYAKAGMFACAAMFAALALFAPRADRARATVDAPIPIDPTRPVWLEIGEAKRFPPDPEAEVRVLAYVNDTVYRHPSVGGVEWMRTGPAMSHKSIELPPGDGYEISFALEFREAKDTVGGPVIGILAMQSRRMTAQISADVRNVPFEGEYPLYFVDEENVRGARIGGSIVYAVRQRR